MSKILVVAEKPSAGRDIARILGVSNDNGTYMENDEYIVTWAVGHLIELKDPEDVNSDYKSWKVEDIPLPADNGLKVKNETKAQFNVIKKLISRTDIEYLINAGDAGREGLLIQSWIYKMAGNRHPVKILWSSSLTDEAIRNAMNHLHDNDEEEFTRLLNEAETRAIVDQMYGYNYTRLLTCIYANPGTVLSYGRCQTTLLNLIVKRDLENENFKSQTFWTLEVSYDNGLLGKEIDDGGNSIKYFDKKAAEEVIKVVHVSSGGIATVKSSKKEEKKEKAPALFNLPELQGVMGKKYGITPDRTLEIAQSLYERHKIMSYPRTDSRYLSTDLYTEIIEHLKCCNFGKFSKYIDQIRFEEFKMDKSYFNNNKVSDHHALIPTINERIPEIYDSLTEDEKHCFDEVVVSLISIFYPAYRYETAEIITEIAGKSFKSSGTVIKDLGFKTVYEILVSPKMEKEESIEIPDLKEGDSISFSNMGIKEDKTKPPARYNPGNITKLMGKYKIGTPATTAGIIKNLIDRRFIKLDGKKYVSTELGRQLLRFIPAVLKAPNMTIEFEETLQKVNSGEIARDDFIEQIRTEILKNKKLFMEHQPAKKLGTAPMSLICPACGRNMREGKSNWYCEGYNKEPNCRFSVWKEISGKKLPASEVEKLLTKKQSGLIKGFKSKGGKNFDAYLVLRPENGELKIGFEFPQRKK